MEGAGREHSPDQLSDGLEFLGAEYEKVMETYGRHIEEVLRCDAIRSYYGCTNFLSKIDREDDLSGWNPVDPQTNPQKNG